MIFRLFCDHFFGELVSETTEAHVLQKVNQGKINHVEAHFLNYSFELFNC